jgi:hypothetical protein
MARMYTVIYSSHIPEKKMDLKKKKKHWDGGTHSQALQKRLAQAGGSITQLSGADPKRSGHRQKALQLGFS